MYKFTTVAPTGKVRDMDVYMVENPSECRHEELSKFHGDVEIDGIIRTVCGVESFAVPFLSKGFPLGLAVKE